MTRLRVTTKIGMLGVACALVALLCAGVLLWWAAANSAHDKVAYQHALKQVELARVMQVDFKKQVQEWKDVLLRGHVPADRERYSEQFFSEEARVRASGQALLDTLSDPSELAAVQRFLAVHESLGQRYRDALKVFKEADGTNYREADTLVRGMDRPPTDMVDDIIAMIERRQARDDVARGRARLRQREITLAVVALVATGLIGASVVVSRRIAAPIVDLTTVVSNVSATHDYSLRAQPSGDGELRRLAEVFNEMLARLEVQTTALVRAGDDLQQQLDIRKRSEAKLAHSLSLLNATIDSTAEGLLVVDRQDRVMLANRKFAEMWRIPPETIAAADDRALVGFVTAQLEDPEGFATRIKQLYDSPEATSFDILTFKDGRIFERYSQPQQVNGVTVGRVWSFRDVTERQRTAEKLEQLNKDLLVAARQAGMAEVATGVLHNVGNLLNSVNVASFTVADAIRHSKSANLAKVVAMLREHKADLAQFLSQEGKGSQLLEYLERLGTVLAGEHAVVLKELAELQKNVEQMKEIVTRQQSFAKVSNRIEAFDPIELVDDSLRINRAAFDRFGISVVNSVEGVGVITSDKSQILQILVNLVRNAVQACAEVARPDKRIAVSLAGDRDQVRFAVCDNGTGIAAENLPKIFSYGFTTKKEGHGFGLHACARMARGLGGTLTMASDGVGQGATFTLELPRQRATDSG